MQSIVSDGGQVRKSVAFGKDRYLEAKKAAREVSSRYSNSQIALFYDIVEREWVMVGSVNTVFVEWVTNDEEDQHRE